MVHPRESITGTVIDNRNNPVSNAVVLAVKQPEETPPTDSSEELDALITVTGNDGLFSFSKEDLELEMETDYYHIMSHIGNVDLHGKSDDNFSYLAVRELGFESEIEDVEFSEFEPE